MLYCNIITYSVYIYIYTLYISGHIESDVILYAMLQSS
jgi:hypothetical protein